MKKSILILLAVICFTLSVKAQEKTVPAPKPAVPAPTYMIKGLSEGQLSIIYQIFNITKQSIPYNKHLKDDAVRQTIMNIDDFSDFLSNNTVPMPVDTAKKPEPPVKSAKKH